ncbi:MAG: DUF502 domain-containing protein [Acidobacteria bacterium]|nr:MAG: DUF502 domain-containing protein [Acidobacteriota bacterium]
MNAEPIPPPEPASLPRSWRLGLRQLFFAGLLILVPLSLTFFVLYQLFTFLDGIFAPLVQQAVGEHVPGVGLLVTVATVLALGWLSTNVLGRRLILLGEKLVARIPVARVIYSGTKGVLETLSQRQTEAFKRVVMIEYPRRGMFSLAFVTGTAHWPEVHPQTADVRMVFLPTTPNPTSGYLLIVPKEQVIDLPMTVEEGIRLVISGGILRPPEPLSAQRAASTASAPETPTSPPGSTPR